MGSGILNGVERVKMLRSCHSRKERGSVFTSSAVSSGPGPGGMGAEAGVEVLSSDLMEGNPGRVQVFAGLEELLDRLADLERRRSGDTSGPAAGTE